MKIMAIVLAIVSCFLLYDLIFGHNGVKQYQTIAAKLEKAQETALVLQKRNQEGGTIKLMICNKARLLLRS